MLSYILINKTHCSFVNHLIHIMYNVVCCSFDYVPHTSGSFLTNRIAGHSNLDLGLGERTGQPYRKACVHIGQEQEPEPYRANCNTCAWADMLIFELELVWKRIHLVLQTRFQFPAHEEQQNEWEKPFLDSHFAAPGKNLCIWSELWCDLLPHLVEDFHKWSGNQLLWMLAV